MSVPSTSAIPPNAVRQLRLVVEVSDLDEAVSFYRDALGLEEEDAIDGPDGARVVILAAGRATLELVNSAQRRMIDAIEVGRDVAPRMRLAFEVNDVEAATAAAVGAHARLVAGPVETPWRSLNARLDAPGDLHLTVFEELDAPHR
jgi:catechol 2,3-dioxygenase-like lactoylglutathione lyase family enzyme